MRSTALQLLHTVSALWQQLGNDSSRPFCTRKALAYVYFEHLNLLSPLTNSRHSGDDDMFSSDLTLETMQMIYSHIRAPVLWLHSGRDEYVPSHVDKQKLMAQMAAASPTTLATVQLPDSDHAISDSASQVLLCQAVLEFVGRVMSDLDAFESSQEASFHGLSL